LLVLGFEYVNHVNSLVNIVTISFSNWASFTNRYAEKASLTITAAFNVDEIFITAKDRVNLSYPAGIAGYMKVLAWFL